MAIKQHRLIGALTVSIVTAKVMRENMSADEITAMNRRKMVEKFAQRILDVTEIVTKTDKDGNLYTSARLVVVISPKLRNAATANFDEVTIEQGWV